MASSSRTFTSPFVPTSSREHAGIRIVSSHRTCFGGGPCHRRPITAHWERPQKGTLNMCPNRFLCSGHEMHACIGRGRRGQLTLTECTHLVSPAMPDGRILGCPSGQKKKQGFLPGRPQIMLIVRWCI